MPRRRRYRQVPWALPIVAAAVLAATYLSARPALAAGSFTTTVVGSAVAESAVMPMGKPATATIVQGSVGLEWAPATYGSGREVGGYIVKRQVLGSADAVQVCAVASPLRTCQDSPPPGQQVIYTVISTEQLWRGPASPPSAPVTMPAAALAATTVASALPAPSPSPTLSATPTPSPAVTPSPTGTASPSPDPTPVPTPS